MFHRQTMGEQSGFIMIKQTILKSFGPLTKKCLFDVKFACLSKQCNMFELWSTQKDVKVMQTCNIEAYQVSKNVLQYDQLQKNEIAPFSWLEDIVCMCHRNTVINETIAHIVLQLTTILFNF